jgi:hypothetical protein
MSEQLVICDNKTLVEVGISFQTPASEVKKEPNACFESHRRLHCTEPCSMSVLVFSVTQQKGLCHGSIFAGLMMSQHLIKLEGLPGLNQHEDVLKEAGYLMENGVPKTIEFKKPVKKQSFLFGNKIALASLPAGDSGFVRRLICWCTQRSTAG